MFGAEMAHNGVFLCTAVYWFGQDGAPSGPHQYKKSIAFNRTALRPVETSTGDVLVSTGRSAGHVTH